MAETTPMMNQYLEMKEQYRDAVLFFRLGDFYEMFNEDAVEISRLLNLTLTHRGPNPMCGIPYHASKVYIARLLRAGRKIAICEQISLPGPGKGLAERRVVEVITPGTAVEDDYLDRTANNYLAALSVSVRRGETRFGFAYIDVTTGEFAATSFDATDAAERFRKETGRIQPREILVQQSILADFPEIRKILDEEPSLVQNRYPDWSFNPDTGRKRLCSVFGTGSLQAFNLEGEAAENTSNIPPEPRFPIFPASEYTTNPNSCPSTILPAKTSSWCKTSVTAAPPTRCSACSTIHGPPWAPGSSGTGSTIR